MSRESRDVSEASGPAEVRPKATLSHDICPQNRTGQEAVQAILPLAVHP